MWYDDSHLKKESYEKYSYTLYLTTNSHARMCIWYNIHCVCVCVCVCMCVCMCVLYSHHKKGLMRNIFFLNHVDLSPKKKKWEKNDGKKKCECGTYDI